MQRFRYAIFSNREAFTESARDATRMGDDVDASDKWVSALDAKIKIVAGLRVKGTKGSEKGKEGTVVKTEDETTWVVTWDGGKTKPYLVKELAVSAKQTSQKTSEKNGGSDAKQKNSR